MTKIEKEFNEAKERYEESKEELAKQREINSINFKKVKDLRAKIKEEKRKEAYLNSDAYKRDIAFENKVKDLEKDIDKNDFVLSEGMIDNIYSAYGYHFYSNRHIIDIDTLNDLLTKKLRSSHLKIINMRLNGFSRNKIALSFGADDRASRHRIKKLISNADNSFIKIVEEFPRELVDFISPELTYTESDYIEDEFYHYENMKIQEIYPFKIITICGVNIEQLKHLNGMAGTLIHERDAVMNHFKIYDAKFDTKEEIEALNDKEEILYNEYKMKRKGY